MSNSKTGSAKCSGSHTCTCRTCRAERDRRTAKGVAGRKRQPWQPRPAR